LISLFILGILTGSLLFVGLWQLEMMWLHKGWGHKGFVLPFGLVVPWWFARDLWYSFIVLAWLIAVIL
jgi:hypothetical protein